MYEYFSQLRQRQTGKTLVTILSMQPSNP